MSGLNTQMRAVVLRGFGGPEVLGLERTPIPEIGDDEVLVRVEAAAVNRIDCELRSGASLNRLSLPLILGREAVGRVVEPGRRVNSWRVGDRVLVLPQQGCGKCDRCRIGLENLCPAGGRPGVNRPGGYAEHTVAPASALVALPVGVSMAEAASAAITMGTAWRALHTLGRLQPGEWTLITGAAGGLGSASVAVAKHLGARVVAAIGSALHCSFVADLGVDVVIDYAREDLVEKVREATGGAGVSMALDHIGGLVFEHVLEAMAAGGRVLTAGAHGAESASLDLLTVFRKEIRIQGVVSQTRAEVEHVLGLIASGSLRPAIGAAYPLAQAADAHRLLESRQVCGKIVLEVG